MVNESTFAEFRIIRDAISRLINPREVTSEGTASSIADDPRSISSDIAGDERVSEIASVTSEGTSVELVRRWVLQQVAKYSTISKRLDRPYLRHLPMACLVLFYIIWFTILSLRLFNTYQSPPFDLSIGDQGLWLLSHFKDPFITVMGRNLFADHTSFIFLLIVPFYRLFPEPQGILILQAILIGASAIPIYMVARQRIGGILIPTALGATFLLNPLLQQENLEQFHPEAFQVLIISIAIYAALNSRGRMLAAMVVLSLLVKEDAAVYTVALGIWVYFRRNRRWGTIIVASSIIYAVIAVEVIIPLLLGTGSLYGSFIPFGGIFGTIREILIHPGTFLTYILSTDRLFYMWQLIIPFGGIFLLAPEIAAIALLAIGENVLSNLPYMHLLPYHYSLGIIPILAMGTVFAIGRQHRARRRLVLTGFVVLMALWSCLIWGVLPFSQVKVSGGIASGSTELANVQAIEHDIPPSAPVSAWYPYVSHIDQRTQIYVWPNPYSTVNWGRLIDNQRLPQASTTTYLMLPVPLTAAIVGAHDMQVFASISTAYRLVDQRGDVGLYKLIGASPTPHAGRAAS